MLCLLMPMVALAQGWDTNLYKQIEQSIRVPQFADKTYLITKYGAKTDASQPRTRRLFRRPSTSVRKKVVVRWWCLLAVSS